MKQELKEKLRINFVAFGIVDQKEKDRAVSGRKMASKKKYQDCS